jgi:16S rRNA (guanine1207-N2)-methyltransferase
MNKPLPVDRHKTLLLPQGEFELQRNPRDDNLQAWDAADEFLLNHLADIQVLSRHGRLLILNDAFGALAVALADHPVYSWNDSFLAQQALRDNLLANGYAVDQVKTNSGIDFPSVDVDCVLIKIPKTRALLEHQLYALRAILHRDTHIIAAGMARNIHNSTLELFESIIGPTTTTRAFKKSRLILVERDHSINEGQSPYPDSYELVVDRSYRIQNHASLFSRDRLDPGSRLLLEHIFDTSSISAAAAGCWAWSRRRSIPARACYSATNLSWRSPAPRQIFGTLSRGLGTRYLRSGTACRAFPTRARTWF